MTDGPPDAPASPPPFPGFSAPTPVTPPVTPPGGGGFPSAPPYAAPPSSSPPGLTPPASETQEPAARKRGRGPVVAFFVILLLVAGAVIAFLVTTARSGSGLTTTLDVCRIDADGSLTAAGRASGAIAKATLTVEFRDTKGNTLVDRGQAVLDVRDDRPAPWQVTGKAGDAVQRVTCTVTDIKG